MSFVANENQIGQGEHKSDDPNDTLELFCLKRAMNDLFYKRNQDSIDLSHESSDGISASKLNKSDKMEAKVTGLGHILKLTPDHITNAKNFRDNLTD